MKLKNADLRNILGRRIKIKRVSNQEDKILEGLTGNVTNPFGCFGDSIVGVFLDPTPKLTMDICNLTLNDEIEFIGEED